MTTIYRPDSVPPATTFLKEFTAFVALLTTFSTPLTITSNINLHLHQVDDVNIERFNVILQTFNMDQHVAVSTHDCAGLLNVVVTGVGQTQTNLLVEDMGLSDHSLISWTTGVSSSASKYIATSKRSWTNCIVNKLKKLLNSELSTRTVDDADIESESADTLVNTYNTIVTSLLDKAAPVSNLTIRKRNHQPEFDFCVSSYKA